MRFPKPSSLAALVMLLLTLAACGGHNSDHTSPTPASPAPPGEATPDAEALAVLRRHYKRLQASYAQIAPIWEALATGQNVQCAEPPSGVDPASINSADDRALQEISVLLRQAAVELDQALRLWQAECANPRTIIPPDVLDRGRLDSRAAGDALREAEALLAKFE